MGCLGLEPELVRWSSKGVIVGLGGQWQDLGNVQ
jgi:hypothetical protein